MKLKDVINFIDNKIPPSLALDFDSVGFIKDYNLECEITNIKVFMDLFPEYDNYNNDTLIITHHPPLFIPKTPTYVIHSNWDIIDNGANDVLANIFNLKDITYFDDVTRIGRVGSCSLKFKDLRLIILKNFSDANITNPPNPTKKIEKIGVISGFGLKNPDYINLAFKKKLDVLISGDLTQETAILSKNLGITLIDLGHHNSEVPGLYRLAGIFDDLNINVEVIDIKPIEKL